MISLRQLLSESTGLKITYVGFAAYALHTLAKFYLTPADPPSVLNILIIVVGILGPLGLVTALLSMIITGVRGAHSIGYKSWWSLWAFLGMVPFVGLAILMLSFSILVKDAQTTIFNRDEDISRLQRLEKKIDEMKSKNVNPQTISKWSHLYAKDAYFYKEEIVEYRNGAGNLIKYQPTEKEIILRKDMGEAPQKIKGAQKGRFIQVLLLFAIPLLAFATAFFIPIKKKI